MQNVPNNTPVEPNRTGKKIDPAAAAVGQRIRLARKGKNYTREKLAEAAEITPQFLAKVEKGEQCMTTGKFAKLVRALNVTSDYLLFGHDDAVQQAELAAEYLARLTSTERDLTAQMVIHLQAVLDTLDSNKKK